MKFHSSAVDEAVEIILKTGEIGSEQTGLNECAHMLADIGSSSLTTSFVLHSVPTEILDRQLEALQSTLDQVITRVKTRIAAIANQRNSVQAAHRLPHEIIVSILSEVLTGDDAVELDYPQRFSQISSYWRAVSESAPSLWTFLAASYPPAYITKALTKSEHLPLCIFADGGKSSDGQVARFLQLVVPHVARWQTATLALSSDECLQYLTIGLAPLLECLTISISGEDWESWDGEPHDLFGGHSGQLRTLEVIGFPVRLNNATLLGLERLGLSYMGEAAPTIGELYETLVNCQRLKSLALWNVGFPAEEHIERAAIRLDQLDTLMLHNLDPRHTIQILSMIEPNPESRSVDIDFDLEHRPSNIIINDLIADIFFPLVHSAPASDVSMVEGVLAGVAPGFTIRGSGSPSSNLVVRRVYRTDALTWFAQAAQDFPSCPPIRVLLQGERNDPIDQHDIQWIRILNDLPHVELTAISLRRQDEITLLTRNFFFPLPTYPQRTSQSHKELRLNSNDDAVYDISDLVHAAYRGGAGSLKTGIIRGEAAETWGWNLRRYPDIEDNWLVVTQVT